MKTEKHTWPGVLFLAVCCALFGGYIAHTRRTADTTPPEIFLPGLPDGSETAEPLAVSVRADEAELLRGVTARDDRDGDVTDGLVVEAVTGLSGGHATVTYAAFDAAGNVAKRTRPLVYTDYTGPEIVLRAPLLFREGMPFRVFDAVGAEDAVDGTIDDRVKGTLQSGGRAVENAGLYEVAFRVTNSLGDTAHRTLPVEVLPPEENFSPIPLSAYLLTLPVGASFDPLSVLPAEYVAGTLEYLTPVLPENPENPEAPETPEAPRGPAVEIVSDVRTEEAGVYSVTYTDTRGASFGKTRLLVVVEESE